MSRTTDQPGIRRRGVSLPILLAVPAGILALFTVFLPALHVYHPFEHYAGAALFGGFYFLIGLSLQRALRRTSRQAEALGREGTEPPRGSRLSRDIDRLSATLEAKGAELKEQIRRTKESESRFRGLIESMSEGLVVADHRERITFVNRRFAKLLDIPAEQLVGLELPCLLEGENKEKLLRENRNRQAGLPSRYELTWRKRDGGRRTTLVSASPLRDRDGRISGSFAVVTDLTERRRLEQRMGRAERFRALGEMAGGIAHDFNNRLTTILGNSQILLLRERDPDKIRLLRIVEQSASEGAETVRRVMDFSRPHAETVREDIDINALLDEVLELTRFKWRDEAQGSGLTFPIRTDYRATQAVSGFPSELREAFLNVLLNAFDAMPDGGEVRVSTVDHSDGVQVSIADQGEGMTREDRVRALDPFFTTRGLARTGLGLSVTWGIVHRHAGTLDLRSEPGEGTTVVFVLPASDRSVPVIRRSETSVRRPAESGFRILVVDDEASIVKLLRLALTGCGHEVRTASGGAQALAVLEEEAVDLLLTDLSLPGMGGVELAREARRLRPALRVAVITGRGAEVQEELGRDGAIDLVVAKPFAVPDLMERIETLLATRVSAR